MQTDLEQDSEIKADLLLDSLIVNVLTYLLLVSSDIISCSSAKSQDIIPARYLIMAFSGLSIVIRDFQMENEQCIT